MNTSSITYNVHLSANEGRGIPAVRHLESLQTEQFGVLNACNVNLWLKYSKYVSTYRCFTVVFDGLAQ